jgi:hypothetical protein
MPTLSNSPAGRTTARGLYYYRARYYNPRLQRFVSSDPIGLAGGLNTNFIDLDGLSKGRRDRGGGTLFDIIRGDGWRNYEQQRWEQQQRKRVEREERNREPQKPLEPTKYRDYEELLKKLGDGPDLSEEYWKKKLQEKPKRQKSCPVY